PGQVCLRIKADDKEATRGEQFRHMGPKMHPAAIATRHEDWVAGGWSIELKQLLVPANREALRRLSPCDDAAREGESQHANARADAPIPHAHLNCPVSITVHRVCQGRAPMAALTYLDGAEDRLRSLSSPRVGGRAWRRDRTGARVPPQAGRPQDEHAHLSGVRALRCAVD